MSGRLDGPEAPIGALGEARAAAGDPWGREKTLAEPDEDLSKLDETQYLRQPPLERAFFG